MELFTGVFTRYLDSQGNCVTVPRLISLSRHKDIFFSKYLMWFIMHTSESMFALFKLA